MDPRKTLALAALAITAIGLFGRGPKATARSPYASTRYPVAILVDGQPLPQYPGRGRQGGLYIEAKQGKDYQIQITNPTGRRIAAAVAVDGLNSIDASHTAPDRAKKWVLEPYETITVSGWQVSSDRLRSFEFATEESSYGAKMGQTSDLGTISVVFYREKARPVPVAVAKPKKASPPPPSALAFGPGAGGLRGKSGDGGAPAASGAPAGPSANAKADFKAAPAPMQHSLLDNKAEKSSSPAEASDQPRLAATAMGVSQDSSISFISMELEPYAASQVEIRYEYREILERLGVVDRQNPNLRNVTYAPEL